jgi:hypothetical protein
MSKFFTLLTLLIVLCLNFCSTYNYKLYNYDIPVNFGSSPKNIKTRYFKIEEKMTYFLFDLIEIEKFDMKQSLTKKLPKAKSIYNLRIDSEEGGLDSFIRLLSTGGQIWAFVSNRPLLFSRRTIVIIGEVEED